MDRETYAAEAALEEHHWWFVGRRRLFAREIGRMRLPRDARVLDVGTSTGTNLRMLRDGGFTNVTGLDLSDEAIRFCREKGLGTVRKGDVCDTPFEDASFDLILATDIIEHVEDDARALAEIRRVLRPGGHALLTVPAFEALWGGQDEVSHHKRRYRKPAFDGLVRAAGLAECRSYHFNYLLFGPIWLARRLICAAGRSPKSENHLNAPGLNGFLNLLFEFDCRTAPLLRPPFGVSILAAVRREVLKPRGGGLALGRRF